MKVSNMNYSEFTPLERLNLTLDAISRRDKTEVTHLVNECPVKNYTAIGLPFSSRLTAIVLVQQLFAQILVYHHGRMQLLEAMSSMTSLVSALAAINDEEAAAFETLYKTDDRVFHITAIIAAYCGLLEFCQTIGVNHDCVIDSISSMVDVREVIEQAFTDSGSNDSAFYMPEPELVKPYKDQFMSLYNSAIPGHLLE